VGAFEYIALDGQGRQQKGVLEGDTPRQIRQLLRGKGLVPVSVEGVAERESRGRKQFLIRRGVSAAALSLMTRQLATLIRSGTVLEEALYTVAQQTEKARLQSIIMAVRSKLMEGHSLAVALGDFPSIFPDLYRATVAAGEQAGHLDVVFERLADYTEFRQSMRQKIMLALLYPTILTLVAIVVVSALLVYVVPQVVTVFENIGQKLPLLTRGLIALSSFLQHYGLFLLIAIICAGILFQVALRRPGVRFSFHQLLLKLPIISKFTRTLNAARFARSFSILTASGVPVLEGMRLSSPVISNLPMRYAVDHAAARVREGGSVHQTLAQSGYFPPLTIHLIASGEASSKLEEMLERAAVTQENEIQTLIATSMGIFEPLLILIMGGIVLIIVLAILLPIFDLNQLVR